MEDLNIKPLTDAECLDLARRPLTPEAWPEIPRALAEEIIRGGEAEGDEDFTERRLLREAGYSILPYDQFSPFPYDRWLYRIAAEGAIERGVRLE